jgi:FkbM family methyltransferase
MNNPYPEKNNKSGNGVLNALKIGLAHAGISSFRFSWQLVKRLSWRPLPAKEHYYIMRLFRAFSKTYYVWISYPNPLRPEKKVRLLVDLCENNQQWYFRERGSYDRQEINLIGEGMKNADVFVDVGSNVGVYAASIAQAFPGKEVEAIEPLEKNFETLQSIIAGNGLTNCRMRQGAVSRAGAPLRFYVNPIHDGGGSLVSPKVYRTGDAVVNPNFYQEKHPEFRSWVEVDTFPLDEIVKKRSVLKIDVEGSEVDALRSGSKALKKGLVDLMVVEVLQETVDEVVRLMEGFDFESFLLPDYSPVSVGTKLPWFVRNIVCVREKTKLHTKICDRAKR